MSEKTDAKPAMEPAPVGWQKWLTQTTAVLAVIAAMSSGRWGASNLNAILYQGKVNDGWAFFQAKSIKQHLAQENAELADALAKQLKDVPGSPPNLNELAAKTKKEAERLESEKNKISGDVTEIVKQRDDCVESSFWFEIAFACLQVGVVLSTIAAGAKKRGLWIAAIVSGLLGAVFVANGYMHFFKTPGYLEQIKERGSVHTDLKIALPTAANGATNTATNTATNSK